MKIRAI